MAREFLGTVTDGKLELFADDRNALRQHIHGWAGKVVVTVRPFKSQRSIKQNARHWGLLTVAARELGYDSVEDLHESVCMHLLRLPDDEVTGLPRRRRTPKLNTAEFAEFTEAVERFFRCELRLDLTGWHDEAERVEQK